MGETAGRIFGLGRIFCAVSVQAALHKAGITEEEVLQFHRRHKDGEARLDQADWKCSPFALPQNGKTVWAITDPEQQTTMLLLEGP